MTSQGERDLRELGRIIGLRTIEIEKRWLERMAIALEAKPGVHLSELRSGVRDYLTGLSQLLSAPADQLLDRGAASWARLAREHGITCVRIGFDIDQLIRELIALRLELRGLAREHGLSSDGVEASLADLTDAAITESVRAYIATRDNEARRRQAENIGFLTHELRNPLAAAMQAGSAVRARAVAAQDRALEILDGSHRRLMELIDSVLDTERLEAGAVEVRRTEIRVGDLIEAATLTARLAAKEKGLAFEVHHNPERRIQLDLELTRSAIQNLVDNAVKYTDLGRVEVAVHDQEASWSVHVRDTCQGISVEELRTIFEPFRRGRTSKHGTGLGLAIARRAIEAQGGSIHGESVSAAGCHFWLRLPVS
jgi:signal transduction histidine kinase